MGKHVSVMSRPAACVDVQLVASTRQYPAVCLCEVIDQDRQARGPVMAHLLPKHWHPDRLVHLQLPWNTSCLAHRRRASAQGSTP